MNQVFIQQAAEVQNRKEGEVSVLQPKFGGFFSLILILLLSPPSWLLVVGLIRERNNEIPTVAAAPFSSNSNKSPSFAINGEFVRIN